MFRPQRNGPSNAFALEGEKLRQAHESEAFSASQVIPLARTML
jgi:hypothetical protein